MALACGKGCCSCCTQSVTITGLEGQQIIAFLEKEARLGELDTILTARHSGSHQPPLTTNEFAKYCLQGIAPEEPISEDWDFSPCPFLRDKSCTIYPVRPFGCRAFISTIPCHETGCAEIEPIALTLNTIFTQLVEHVAQGHSWGKMLDILRRYRFAGNTPKKNGQNPPLRDAKAIPGLIVCEGEQKAVKAALGPLLAKSLKNGKIKEFLSLEGII
ncbi:MAG: hypothetical protein OEL55_02615 [Desulfobulbaceae bacterium]|nr:hypothetical protein [Desulfobulbaceae bacterium]